MYFHVMMHHQRPDGELRVGEPVAAASRRARSCSSRPLTAPLVWSIRLQPVPTMTSEITYGHEDQHPDERLPAHLPVEQQGEQRSRPGPGCTSDSTTMKALCRSASWNVGVLEDRDVVAAGRRSRSAGRSPSTGRSRSTPPATTGKMTKPRNTRSAGPDQQRDLEALPPADARRRAASRRPGGGAGARRPTAAGPRDGRHG